MKLYISDKYKLDNCMLPSKIEDSFLLKYISIGGIEESITLVAENGKWTIKSNLDMKIMKNCVEITKDELSDNKFYQIKFSDLDYYIDLYCFDTPISFYKYKIKDNRITLGRNNCSINYDNTNMSSPQCEIINQSGYWLLKDSGIDNSIVYVNGKRSHQTFLKMGDVIFAYGLKIIWMVDFIEFNNSNNCVNTILESYESFSMLGIENKYMPVKETEKAIQLYNDNQAFFHTPRLKQSITLTTINIEKPPEPVKDDGPPPILTLGATIMMGISSSITGVMSIFTLTRQNGNMATAITQLIVCLAMIIGTICFPILLSKYNKRRIKTKEKLRQQKYGKYLSLIHI